ncbi:MAG: hypothetical protein LBE18_00035 [Planctomycetaceae bacterium]|jgi:hypothetical protein|nr:hypothetical protein [Planctomycetaceae bacterium]
MTDIFITVKTYPTLSSKYDELVCTAGITDAGKWVRLYPVPFRKLDWEQRYAKYQWLSIPLERNTADIRPESYRIKNINAIEQKNKISDWNVRRQIILENTPVYTNMNLLIEKAKNNELSLATLKPTKITDFIAEETERDWSKDKLEHLIAKTKQLNFFQTPDEIKKELAIVRKVPYKFSYQFIDETGKERKLMIEDWETGMLYWNCLKSTNNNEKTAIEKVKQKYFNEFLKKDIFLFLGTTKEFHFTSPNPFVIIGVFAPPVQNQKTLF